MYKYSGLLSSFSKTRITQVAQSRTPCELISPRLFALRWINLSFVQTNEFRSKSTVSNVAHSELSKTVENAGFTVTISFSSSVLSKCQEMQFLTM